MTGIAALKLFWNANRRFEEQIERNDLEIIELQERLDKANRIKALLEKGYKHIKDSLKDIERFDKWERMDTE